MLILATDMARHGEIMDSFKSKIELKYDWKDKEHTDTVICDVCMGIYDVD